MPASSLGWDINRPIYTRTPDCYKADEEGEFDIADARTRWKDATITEIQTTVGRFAVDYLDPDTAKPEALDWLAQVNGFTGRYWDYSWSVPIKRQLIRDSQWFLWQKRGTPECLNYLFGVFSLDAKTVTVGQWKLGVTPLAARLGGNPFDLKVELPPRYTPVTPEYTLINRLIRLYAPAWITVDFVYRATD